MSATFLQQALAPVLADVESTLGPIRMKVEEPSEEWPDMSVIEGVGVVLDEEDGLDRAIVEVAEVVQEVLIEGSLSLADGTARTWPPCPSHEARHPLFPKLLKSGPSWVCRGGSMRSMSVVSHGVIGQLSD